MNYLKLIFAFYLILNTSYTSVVYAQAIEKSHELSFKMLDGQVIVISENPSVDEIKDGLGLSVSEEVRRKIEAQGGFVEEKNPLDGWQNLSYDQKENFQVSRRKYLKNMFEILNKTHGLVGAGIVTADGIKYVYKKTKDALIIPDKNNDLVVRKELALRKKIVIESLVKSVDYKLWYQAPLVINANEFGLQSSIGIIGIGGMMKAGGGGLEEFGISLSYNKTTKTFVFEVFHNTERFDNSAMPVIDIGVNFKAQVKMKANSGSSFSKIESGQSFYPPAFPGTTSQSSDAYAAGFSSGFGFPPPPLADILTFTTNYKRSHLIRISVSPIVKGFIRVSFGNFLKPVKSVVFLFGDIFKLIYTQIKDYKNKRNQSRAEDYKEEADLKKEIKILACQHLFN